uniref:Uncharacterized protein n=1 Tax=Rhodnius prolixus TaxID=13249 RepID=T1H9H4_RHOPR
MKTTIVVTFFGFLGCTFCKRVPTPEGCRDVYNEADPNFKLKKFFNGSWYLTHAKHQNHSVLCTKFDMTMKPLEIKYEMGGVNVTCVGTKIKGTRRTEYVCKGNGTPTAYTDYEATMSVIGTDYTGYATVYVCKKNGKHKDNVFVLSRTRTGEPSEAAKQSLQKLRENLSSFHKFPCINFDLIKL